MARSLQNRLMGRAGMLAGVCVFTFVIKKRQISEQGEPMLLQKINKRHVIFNNILKSGDVENLHSLRFDFLQHDQRWRFGPRNREFGRIGRTLLWVLGISALIYMATFILRSHA